MNIYPRTQKKIISRSDSKTEITDTERYYSVSGYIFILTSYEDENPGLSCAKSV